MTLRTHLSVYSVNASQTLSFNLLKECVEFHIKNILQAFVYLLFVVFLSSFQVSLTSGR